MIVGPLLPLVVALGFALHSERPALEGRPNPGSGPPPPSACVTGGIGIGGWSSFNEVRDFLEYRYEDLMTWDENPWKRPRNNSFGAHYFMLSGSSDPIDRARAEELRRLARVWMDRLVATYPSLGTETRVVPDETNGFLQWLDFLERHGAGPPWTNTSLLKLPANLQNDGWNREEAETWLAANQTILDEVRAIGLLPDRSTAGIPLDRWHFVPARTMKECTDALLIEARLRAENGDAEGAIESVEAVRGLPSHLAEVETPSLLAATVDILVQRSLQHEVLTHILPALPPDRIDLDRWEQAVRAEVRGPAGFARLMRGEWELTSGYWIIPMLCDPEETRLPSDPDALVDFHASYFDEVITRNASDQPGDLSQTDPEPTPDFSRLSRRSRSVAEMMYVGAGAWRRGWAQAQSSSALTRAAFSMMRGEPVPKDPVRGLPYRWDPATRVLSMPDHASFDEMRIEPIVVPRK